MCRLLPGDFGSLYFARGLFEIGHGEPVVAFRVTTSSKVLSFSVPNSAGRPSSSTKKFRRKSESPAATNLWLVKRLSSPDFVNIAIAFFR